jgi:PmbA protein
VGPEHLQKTAHDIRETAVRAGAQDAECLIRESRSLRIEIRDGRVDGVQRREEISAALRILKGGREGLAFTTSPEESSYPVLVKDALDSARLMPSLPENRFSEETSGPVMEEFFDASGLALEFEEKADLAREVEGSVLAAGNRIRKAHKPSYFEQSRETAMASGGCLSSWRDTVFSLGVEAVAESEGESQSGHEYRAFRRLSDIDPKVVGESAAREALDLLGGDRPPSGSFPAVFPPKVALDLLASLVSSFSAEEMIKKRSRLEGRRGEKVFSDCLTISDNGTVPWLTGSVAFDDERVLPVPRNLVDRGVVTGCLHTLKTAAIMSEEPTGNGFRPSMTSPPVPGPSNFFIRNGTQLPGVLTPTGKAVRFSSLMGSHTIDGVSGDFSLGASGHVLDDGEVAGPFRNGTVSGNIFDMMASLSSVGDDLTFYGAMGSPTLLFSSVIVSGS